MQKVLFIGNSHTYYNDMVKLFADICKEYGIEVHCVALVSDSKTLEWHACEKDVQFNILYGDYDYIVMQDAAHPFAGKESLLKGVAKLNKYISQTNSKRVLFMTWKEKRFLDKQQEMSTAYLSVGEKTKSLVAPVGDIWANFDAENPDLELYFSDGEHANEKGSLLAAIVIANTIFNLGIDVSDRIS